MLIALVLGLSVLALAVAWSLRGFVLRQDNGTPEMRKISDAIQEGAEAFLRRQYRTIGLLSIALGVLIYVLYAFFRKPHSGEPAATTLALTTTLSFLFGAFCSGVAGLVGMYVAVRSNIRTASAARSSLNKALQIALRGGAVSGLFVVAMSLFGVGLLYSVLDALHFEPTKIPLMIVGYGFGASFVALFAQLGGGICTKAADVGADLVGKVEAGIPEDDPRNPAVIADNVGDNVGDCAGMAADLFETYAVTMIAAMLLGSLLFKGQIAWVIYPLLLGAVSVVGSIVGTFFVRVFNPRWIMGALYAGLLVAVAIAVVGFYIVTQYMGAHGLHAGGGVTNPNNLFWAGLVGVVITILIISITEFFTETAYWPVHLIAKASVTGHATDIIAGQSIGMMATALPVTVIGIGILISYNIGGLYGIAIAAVAMLSMTGIIVAIDSYGPITDNAGGIAEMADLPEEVRGVTDPLDAVGNTTKAVTKGYAIGSAGLAALVLFASYTQELTKAAGHSFRFDLSDPSVIVGLFLGGILPFLFGSLAMLAVGRAGGLVVEQVRRQFRENPGIMAGTARPEYGRAVSIVTAAAQREMIVPGIIPVAAPLLVGFVLGPVALGGMLVGAIVTGLFLALQMTSGGAAWDNAKKYIEEGNLGGKGSEAHKAAVTGDTVGDPNKDTAGPAINPMIKVVNIIAILVAASVAAHSLLH